MGLIRFVLSFHVLFAHFYSPVLAPFMDGIFAIQMFFMISGFCISFTYFEKYISIKDSYKVFITNRAARILPAYWFVYFIYLATRTYQFGWDVNKIFPLLSIVKENILVAVALCFNQLFILGQDLLPFLELDRKGNLVGIVTNEQTMANSAHFYMSNYPAWTLSIEFIFYLIAPFVLKRRNVVIMLLLLSLAVRAVTWYGFNLHNDPWIFRFFPQEFFFIFLGYVSYLNLIKDKAVFRPNSLAKAGLLFYILLLFFPNQIDALVPDLPIQLSTLVLCSISIWVFPIFFNLTKNSKLDRLLGDLSFLIYICHTQAGMLWKVLPVKGLEQLTGRLFYTFVLVVVTYALVEIPVKNLRARYFLKSQKHTQ